MKCFCKNSGMKSFKPLKIYRLDGSPRTCNRVGVMRQVRAIHLQESNINFSKWKKYQDAGPFWFDRFVNLLTNRSSLGRMDFGILASSQRATYIYIREGLGKLKASSSLYLGRIGFLIGGHSPENSHFALPLRVYKCSTTCFLQRTVKILS